MEKKTVSGIMLTLLLMGMLTLTFNIQPSRANGIIRIKADGSVDPPTAPISSVDNVTYTFTDNINNSVIVVERDNVVVDGAGYTTQGGGTGYGFGLFEVKNVTIKKTNISSFSQGIMIQNSSYNSVSDSNVTNGGIGIMVISSIHTIIHGNNVTNNNDMDIYIWDSTDNTITGNTVSGRFDISYSPSNKITDNNVMGVMGIDISYSPDNTITNNIVSGGGIDISNSPSNTITNNTISGNNGRGIDISNSPGNTITGNIVSGNNGTGIAILDSTGNTITNNIIINNRNGIWVDNSSNSIIDGSNISKNQEYGIFVDESSPNTLSGNNVTNNMYGIKVNASDYTTVSHNYVENNTNGIFAHGISLYYSNYNNISHNHVENNTNGIWMQDSDENILSNNNITRNTNGIYMQDSDENILRNNNITRNTLYGIRLVALSSFSRIYHNNFINNTNQIYIDEPKGVNIWDDEVIGYPSGGNFWSDYTGNDAYKGPDQNIAGSDGIGDEWYIIASRNIDHYPLTPPPPPHDIGIINVKKSKTVVGQNYSLYIRVDMVNYGSNMENFNLTLYSNGTPIGRQNITLPKRKLNTLTFTWNTTGVAKGNYIITAIADTVPGEVDTDDNLCEDGWVLVAIVGDITGPDGWPDGKCDMRDIATIARFFGQSVPPAPSNCDITGPTTGVPDGKIDMRDVATAARHFGEKDP